VTVLVLVYDVNMGLSQIPAQLAIQPFHQSPRKRLCQILFVSVDVCGTSLNIVARSEFEEIKLDVSRRVVDEIKFIP
jgi:hypothetical protein